MLSTDNTIRAGTVIDDYRVVGFLGRGGMAEVFEAQELGLRRNVALKILPSSLARLDGAIERFRREVNSASSLDHRGIVQIYRVGYDHSLDIHYFAMRLLRGGDLTSRIRSGLPLGRTLSILRELAAAFEHAHSRGLVHRDVKPANILFDEQDWPVLTDFGIARTLGQDQTLTLHGAIIGTPAYMSPEQASGGTVDARSDIYSLGIVLYEMLTGRAPFRGEPLAIAYQHVHQAIPRLPSQLEVIQPLLDRLTEKNSSRRLGSASELMAWINRISASGIDPELLSGERPASVHNGASTPRAYFSAEPANPGATDATVTDVAETRASVLPGAVLGDAEKSEELMPPKRRWRKSGAAAAVAVAAAAGGGWMLWDRQGESDPPAASSPNVTVIPSEPVTATVAPAELPSPVEAAVVSPSPKPPQGEPNPVNKDIVRNPKLSVDAPKRRPSVPPQEPPSAAVTSPEQKTPPPEADAVVSIPESQGSKSVVSQPAVTQSVTPAEVSKSPAVAVAPAPAPASTSAETLADDLRRKQKEEMLKGNANF